MKRGVDAPRAAAAAAAAARATAAAPLIISRSSCQRVKERPSTPLSGATAPHSPPLKSRRRDQWPSARTRLRTLASARARALASVKFGGLPRARARTSSPPLANDTRSRAFNSNHLNQSAQIFFSQRTRAATTARSTLRDAPTMIVTANAAKSKMQAERRLQTAKRLDLSPRLHATVRAL